MSTTIQTIQAKTTIKVVGQDSSETVISANNGTVKVVTVNTGFMGPQGPKGDVGAGSAEWLSEEW